MSQDQHERRHRRTHRNSECMAVMANANFDAAPSLADAMGLESAEPTQTKTTKTRRPPKTVTGTCRWAVKPNLFTLTGGVLAINDTEYAVEPIDAPTPGPVAGFAMTQADGTEYAVDVTWTPWLCSCPDSRYRNRACKHCKALTAAFVALTK